MLDELRLDPARFERALVRAFARRAAAAGPRRAAAPTMRRLIEELQDRPRARQRPADFRDWLARNGADHAALGAALAAEDRLAVALDAAAAELAPALLESLRVDGRYEALARRAADKRVRLADRSPRRLPRARPRGCSIEALCARRRV